MIKTIANSQRGVTLSGLLMWLVILLFGVISSMKIVPAYIENAEIEDILIAIVDDPDMQRVPSANIRTSFSRRAIMNNIKVISSDDIEVVKDAEGLSLSASYQVEISLIGNASLLLEFNPNSLNR